MLNADLSISGRSSHLFTPINTHFVTTSLLNAQKQASIYKTTHPYATRTTKSDQVIF